MQTYIGNEIALAKNYLLKGELVAIPTETVYGLAANALNTTAVLKIFEVKNRPQFNPLIIHCANWHAVEKYVKNIPPKVRKLAEVFTPGPLTFLLDKREIIPDLVTSGSSKVAVRIPDHPLTLALLFQLDFPLAAPSANPFGYISPTSAAHVFKNLSGKIPYILDGGDASVGIESTIIGFNEEGRTVLYRRGSITVEAIENVLQDKVIIAKKVLGNSVQTAGQLKSHYAPHTPLYVGDIDELTKKFAGKKMASISFFNRYDSIDSDKQFVLSPSGQLHEAAKNLFAALRVVDELGVDVILAEVFPDEGIGKAINDRLDRASEENK